MADKSEKTETLGVLAGRTSTTDPTTDRYNKITQAHEKQRLRRTADLADAQARLREQGILQDRTPLLD